MNFAMVSNPKKTVVVSFSLDKVLATYKRLIEGMSVNNTAIGVNYKIDTQDDILKQLTISATEMLSMGVYIDINLEEISSDKTGITVEVRRKIGSFDQSVEVQLANQHINNVLKTISELLTNPDMDYGKVKEDKDKAQAESTAAQWKIIGYIVLCITILVMLSKC